MVSAPTDPYAGGFAVGIATWRDQQAPRWLGDRCAVVLPVVRRDDAIKKRFQGHPRDRSLSDRLGHAYFVRCDRRAGWTADDCVDRGALVRESDALATPSSRMQSPAHTEP